MQDIHRSTTTWLARRTGRNSHARPPHRSHRRRFTLEPLECRALLSLTTWTVNSLGDAGTGTGTSGDLRYVITQADQTQGDNTINFSVTGTITLNSALPDLSNTTGLMDIEGPGASSLTVARSSAAGTPDFGIFTVEANVNARLLGLTITGGSGVPGQDGGGINNSGTLTVISSTIEDNSVTFGSPSPTGGFGGGIYNGGTLTVTNSTIEYNSTLQGGGIYNEEDCSVTVTDSTIANNPASWGGGGIYNGLDGSVTVTNSTIADNSGPFYGGGIYNDGPGTLTVTNSTIAGNSSAGGDGGGIYSEGSVTVTNSTIADNSANYYGGGIGNDVQGTLAVTNCTVVDNLADSAGGGLWANGLTTRLDNTLIALNTSGSGTPDDVDGSVFPTSAYNLTGTGGSGGLVNGTNGNQVGVADPGLDPNGLQNNGGPTQTIALLANSPAIDAGSNALAVDPRTYQPLTTDQRGIGFSRIVNNTVDIGACEFQTTPTAATHLSFTVQPPSAVLTGSAFGLVVSAEDISGVVTPSFNGTVSVALLNNPGGATLGGTVSVTAQSGVATFTGLTLNQVGIGYTLQISSNGLTSVTSNAVDVQASGSPTRYTVDLTSDNGTGSGSKGDLRYVIAQADADTNPLGSVIQFDPTVFASPQTITLNSALPDLSNTTGLMDIEGPGASSLIVARSGAAGTPDFGILTVDAFVQARLVGLTITGGLASSGSGINNAGTLTVTNSTVESNVATYGSSIPIGFGGGIYNGGTLTVTNTTVDNNSAPIDGGGGGIDNSGTLTVTNSTIDNNLAGWGGGGICNFGTVTVTNSTVAGNSAAGYWPYHDGGGILSYNGGTLTVVDSTIYNNSANGGGGGIVIFPGDTANVTNSTIAGNWADGISNVGGTLTLNNTLIALNTSDTGTPDEIDGPVSSTSAYNLIGTGSSGGLVNGATGNQVGVADPGLDPNGLQNNGGPTQTIALMPGSPAIDAGSNALAVDPTTGLPLTTDQRGAGFPRIVNGTVDIGAYEVQSYITAVAVGWGTRTAALQTASDGLRLLPAGRNTDLPWMGIDLVQLTLTQPATLAAGDITAIGSSGTNYGPVTVSGSDTSYTITLAQPINAADRVTITIGNELIASFTRRLDVLPGDVNDDGVVNVQDLVAIRNQMLGLLGAVPTLCGDINGDGKVDINDYIAVRKLIGTTLSPIT